MLIAIKSESGVLIFKRIAKTYGCKIRIVISLTVEMYMDEKPELNVNMSMVDYSVCQNKIH